MMRQPLHRAGTPICEREENRCAYLCSEPHNSKHRVRCFVRESYRLGSSEVIRVVAVLQILLATETPLESTVSLFLWVLNIIAGSAVTSYSLARLIR